MGRFVQSQQDAWNSHDRLAIDPRVIFLDEPRVLDAVFCRLTQAGTQPYECVRERVARPSRPPSSASRRGSPRVFRPHPIVVLSRHESGSAGR
jgi:hypothetical protein